MDIELIKHRIDELYNECLSTRKPFHKKLDLLLVPHELAEIVLKHTNFDISNHWISIDNYGIIHSLSQHSNPISEAKRGQIAILKEDLIDFLDTILFPDNIQFIGYTHRTNLPLIQFEKTIQTHTVVIKEIRTITRLKKNKLSRIVFHTMYKKQKSNKD